MSQDQNFKPKNIEKLLDNIPDNVKDMLFGLIQGADTHDGRHDSKHQESKSNDHEYNHNEHGSGHRENNHHDKNQSDNFNNFEALMHAKNLFEKFSDCKDHKIDLINALKPFLRPKRQEKATQCLHMLRLSKFFQEAFSLVKHTKP